MCMRVHVQCHVDLPLVVGVGEGGGVQIQKHPARSLPSHLLASLAIIVFMELWCPSMEEL